MATQTYRQAPQEALLFRNEHFRGMNVPFSYDDAMILKRFQRPCVKPELEIGLACRVWLNLCKVAALVFRGASDRTA